MPAESNTAGQARTEQSSANAAAQQPAQAAPAQSTEDGGQQQRTDARQSIMDRLDIPADVQAQIMPKPAEPAAEEDGGQRSEVGGQSSTSQPLTDSTDQDDHEQEHEQEQEGEEEGAEETPNAERPTSNAERKKQKRIDRLTRQKHELEEQLDAAHARLQQFEEQGANGEENGQSTASAAPRNSDPLGHIRSEQDLNKELARARAVMDYCDANPEGVTAQDKDGNDVFRSPQELDRWRREAEKVVLNAPLRLDSIRQFTSQRTKYDTVARETWPELFPKKGETTPEYLYAVNVLREFPQLANHPQANFVLGMLVEGRKALDARVKAEAPNTKHQTPNGEQKQRAISDVAFNTPRVPLAPHSASAPNRNGNSASPRKKVDEAVNDLMADPDGGSAALAQVFNAKDAAASSSSPKPRQLVHV